MTPLPASVSYPVAQRLSPGGQPYFTEIVLVSTDTGRPYRVTIAGSPPAFVFTPVPTVADIRADFASVQSMRQSAATVALLRTWGF